MSTSTDFTREASRHRGDLATSCSFCRSKKIKCDAVKPTCTNCQSQTCHYAIRQKPGFKAGLRADVQERLAAVESLLAEHTDRLAEHELRLPPTVQSESSNTIPFSASPLQLDFLSTFQQPPFPESDVSDASGILPPDDIVRDLIRLYFIHIHPSAPLISPCATFNPPWPLAVHAIVFIALRYSTDSRLVGEKARYRRNARRHVVVLSSESTSMDTLQALAILALDAIGEGGPASWGILAMLCRSVVHLNLMCEEEITIAGPMSSSGVPKPPAPTLNRTIMLAPVISWEEDEARRRLFWIIYCLDRYTCLSTGWSFAFSEQDIRRRYPCTDTIWAQSTWSHAPLFNTLLPLEQLNPDIALSPLAYLAQSLNMLGHAHSLHADNVPAYDPKAIAARVGTTADLTSRAQEWYRGIVSRVGSHSSIGILTQAIHFANLMKLNAYYAFPANSDTGQIQEPYAQICLSAIRGVVRLTDSARQIGWSISSTPMFIWVCWVAARGSFIHTFATRQQGPNADFDRILDALVEQGHFWNSATQFVYMLQRAKRHWQRQRDMTRGPYLSDAVHMVLDLHRPAYTAMTGVSEETPAVTPTPDEGLRWEVPFFGDLNEWFNWPIDGMADQGFSG